MSKLVLHHNVDVLRALQFQTIAGSNIQSGNLDLKGFNSAKLVIDFGDIAEMGASPEGAAQIDVQLEHADDDGTGSPGAYADVTAADVVGEDVAGTVTSGIVKSTVTDVSPLEFGYVGGKRFARLTLQPTGLTTGGPVGAWVLRGNPLNAPVA